MSNSIRSILKRRLINQKELAKELRVHHITISKFITNKDYKISRKLSEDILTWLRNDLNQLSEILSELEEKLELLNDLEEKLES